MFVKIPELRIVDDDVFAGALAIVEDRAARRDERRKLLASRSRPERRAEHRRQIRDWRLARRKETGRVCALFARRLYCSVHKRALRRDGDVYVCPASKTCANRGLTIGLLTALCAAAAKALTADDLAAWHAGAAVEARRARLRAEIAGAEARFDDWHRKTTEAVAALGAGNPPQALREWCAVNEDKMRQARLDAAWGRIALERLAPPSNPERVIGKFKDLVRRWEADPRDPNAVTRLRHAMKRFTIVPGPVGKKEKRRFHIEIDYDFEAMVKVFGPPRKAGRRPGSETAEARRGRG